MEQSLDDFFSSASSLQNHVLMLDYDGTLAPFHSDRMQAYPYEGVLPLISQISRLCRVVIISGRSIDVLRKFLPLDLEMWGSHGLERCDATGNISRPELPDADLQLLKTAREVVPDSWQTALEDKYGCLAIHWRGRQIESELKEQLLNNWLKLSRTRPQSVVHPFNGGIELRVGGKTKADAARSIIGANLGVNHSGKIAYLGDDLTDEDAFLVLRDVALCVLVEQEARPSLAHCRIKAPKGLLNFLERWLLMCTGGGAVL